MLRNFIFILSFLFLPILFILISYNFEENQNKKIEFTDVQSLKFCKELSFEENLNLHPDNFYSNINLEIKFLSEREWKRSLLNGLIKSEKNKKDSNHWRRFTSKSKRHSGLVLVNVPNKFKCKIKARIRTHGDLMDQRDSSLLPSLNVHLNNGHLFGITKFILFIPKSRNYENEIFASKIFEEVGILSPKTRFINLNYGKSVKKFIFQEKIHKEFLESNSLREGPILEGDERFLFWDPRHSQHLSKNKIVNVNWSEKGKTNYEISEYSISLLNHINQLYQSKEINDDFDYFTLGKKFFKKNLFNNLDIMDSLAIAMGSNHTMPRNERRFYFDPLSKTYSPIYYDGMFNILDKGNINYFLQNEKEMIIPSVKNGAKKSLELINNLNVLKLHEKLNGSGVKISLDQTKKKVIQIKNNLIKIKDFEDKKIISVNFNKTRNAYINHNENYNQSIKRKLIFYSDNFNNYLKCNIYGKNCIETKLKEKEKIKLINQELTDRDGNHLIFIGKRKKGNPSENWIYQEYFFQPNNFKLLENNVKILKYGQPEIKINKNDKKIFIKRNNLNDKVIFSGGNLNDWHIKMEDFSLFKNQYHSGIDKNNLTGCLNFYDIEVKNLTLVYENSKCEDAINFVRAKGTINNLTITNSFFDAMDADYSNLKFKDIFVNKSMNDCLDFSFGIYEVEKSSISFCGDKAVSVGEKSILKIFNSNISDSNSGVVSKDYATVNISNSKIINTKLFSSI